LVNFSLRKERHYPTKYTFNELLWVRTRSGLGKDTVISPEYQDFGQFGCGDILAAVREEIKKIMRMEKVFLSRCNNGEFHTLLQRQCENTSSIRAGVLRQPPSPPS
jgi:hypothetical protein